MGLKEGKIEDIVIESKTVGTTCKRLIPTVENDANGDIENIYFPIVLIVYYDNSLEILTKEEYDKYWKEYSVNTDILTIKEVKIEV